MLAVTTRNKLHSPRFFLPMVRAWLLIRRQLRRTPGMVRYMTGIANLTEFYTLTIWETPAVMFNFTASSSHRQMMWMFTRWSKSFWSMRWEPTTAEIGAWDNLKLTQKYLVPKAQVRAKGTGWLTRSPMAEALKPYIDTVGRPEKRKADPSGCGVSAILARIVTRTPMGLYRLKHNLHLWQPTPGLLRATVGFGPGECLLITLWQANAGEKAQALMESIADHHANMWAMQFTAGDYEVGHWDGLRLRSKILYPKILAG